MSKGYDYSQELKSKGFNIEEIDTNHFKISHPDVNQWCLYTHYFIDNVDYEDCIEALNNNKQNERGI
jgi:hypothetical protein